MNTVNAEYFESCKADLLKKHVRGMKCVIYGEVHAEVLNTLLKQCKIEVDCIIDDDTLKEGKESKFGPVKTLPSYLKENEAQNTLFIIAIAYYNKIRSRLLEFGGGVIVYIDLFLLQSDDAGYISSNWEAYEKNMELFEDELSREIYRSVLEYRISHDFSRILNLDIDSSKKYFEFTDRFHDLIFLDAGAYDGNSIQSFLKWGQGKYKEIHAVEPGPQPLSVMKKKLKELEAIFYYKSVLGDRQEEGCLFDSSGMTGARLSENGDMLVDMDTIDHILEDKKGHILIKMDIEGAETIALKGAERVIRACRPELAICVYHSAEDMLRIPQMIQNYGGYRLYLRHYSEGAGETVCYGIPYREKGMDDKNGKDSNERAVFES